VSQRFDIVVVGAGMAGASIVAEIAPHASVVVVEGEQFPGYHTTGRSAAFWAECYGGPAVVPLTLASGWWLTAHGFMRPRGALHMARAHELTALDAFEQTFAGTGVLIARTGRAEMEALVPGLKPAWVAGISEPNCADIDVAGLHQHYLTTAKRAGAQLLTGHRLISARRDNGLWYLGFVGGVQITATTLVNAAGAWADEVALLAGARPIGMVPYRRTVAQLRVEPAVDPELPLVLGIDGSFYFKPENGRLWLSPHDETASPPCDAAPEELDVATAIDRFEQVVDWRVAAVERKWAGLRTFAPDRVPVYGPDPHCPGLFWFAGQGGVGIQTAPAAARLAAQMLLDLPREAMTQGLDPAVYSPARFS
jgi:D-arginine dehydrogenase